MKKLGAVLLLGIILVAAFFAVKNIGLFNRSGAQGPSWDSSQTGGSGQTMVWPQPIPLGGLGSMPMVTFPGGGDGPPALSQKQTDKVFHDWTCPHATDVTQEYLPQGTSAQQNPSLSSRYTRVLYVDAPPSAVFRFYASKVGSKAFSPDFYRKMDQQASLGASASSPSPLAPPPLDSGSYSKGGKDYTMQASLTYPIDHNFTRVVLQIAPRMKGLPAKSGRSPTTTSGDLKAPGSVRLNR